MMPRPTSLAAIWWLPCIGLERRFRSLLRRLAGHRLLPCQVGINSDVGVTPGVRIPSSEEPDLYTHLQIEGSTHGWIEGGASTILEFDQTAAGNPKLC